MSASWRSLRAATHDFYAATGKADMYRFLNEQALRFGPGAPRDLARVAVRLAGHVGRLIPFVAASPLLPVTVMGLDFPNPIGLAAGFDKNGSMVGCLGPAGFGFVEIGTVTPNHRVGGDDDIGIAVSNLERTRFRRPRGRKQVLGINVGSARGAFSEQLIDDYVSAMRAVWDYADYLTVNLSSPRGWIGDGGANAMEVRMLLERIKKQHATLVAGTGRRVPLAVKVAATGGTIPVAAGVAGDLRFDAVIMATNRTEPSDLVCRRIRELADCLSPVALISVGGITSADGAWTRLQAGAALVQIYTGLVEEGPFLARRIVRRLRHRYARQGKDDLR